MQPAFLAAIFSGDEVTANCSGNNGNSNGKGSDSTYQALKSDNAKPLVDTLVIYVERSDVLVKRYRVNLCFIIPVMFVELVMSVHVYYQFYMCSISPHDAR